MKRPKLKRPKALTYTLIEPTSDVGAGMYERLYAILDEHHAELSRAQVRIALAWCTSWKPDVDGRITLGKCKKASDLDRELAPYDFVILLSQDFWLNARVSDVQRAALMDHELCHAAVAYDENGDPKVDARGRTVFRIRKHTIEEFTEIVDRYGCYKADVEAFARALYRAEHGAAAAWVGYSRLHETLQAIGLEVPATLIATWTDDERREALTWALMRRETNVRVNLATSETIPACIAAAMQNPPPAGDQPTTH